MVFLAELVNLSNQIQLRGYASLKKKIHLSCPPNFPRASYLDERTLTYEPIVNLRNL